MLESGEVVCWGAKTHASLCRRNRPTTPEGTHWLVDLHGKRAVDVSVGADVTCVATADGEVGCFGVNSLGMLGRGTLQGSDEESMHADACFEPIKLGLGLEAKQVSVGDGHVCALLDVGKVKCWGSNESGQLGLGRDLILGNRPNQMGDELPCVDLGKTRSAKEISSGGLHTCAILDNDTLKCWGDNTTGQLGLGDTNNRGDEPAEMGDALPAVDLARERRVRGVAAGHQHTCALLDNGAVKCWGAAVGDARGDTNGEMGDALPAVEFGTKALVRQIHAGGWSACVVTDAAIVECRGDNSLGQLGLGYVRSVDETGAAGEPIAAINLGTDAKVETMSLSFEHACALISPGRIKCWGAAKGGILGYGDSETRGDEPNEMGDGLPVVDLCKGAVD